MLKGRIVDLSHTLYPGKEKYKLETKRYFVDELWPEYKRNPEDWYIVHEITLNSHVGTHIEMPQHYVKEGKDVTKMPLERLVGDAVLLDFTYKKGGEAIYTQDFERYSGLVKEGDIVFLNTGWYKYYMTEKAKDRPYITMDGIKWLISKRISCLGADLNGIEQRGGRESQPNHKALFKDDIPLIECLTNLGEIKSERFTAVILPISIEGLEAFPVRVIAIEK